jgi:Cu(I)/Ag(I) efflux system membrane protein CusA/SilA
VSAERRDRPEAPPPADGWARLVGWFVHNQLIVFILVGMLGLGGVAVSPFAWDLGPLPRSPVPIDAIPDIGEN